MSKLRSSARFSCKTSGFRMVGAMRERPWRGAARSLFIHVCRRSPIATSIKEKRKSVYEKKKNTTTGIDHRNDVLRAPSGTRTLDTLIKSQVLYQLS